MRPAHSSCRRRRTRALTPSCASPSLRAVFPNVSDEELASLKKLGMRWKEYVKEGKIIYEEHQFWVRRRLLRLARKSLADDPFFLPPSSRSRASASGHSPKRVRFERSMMHRRAIADFVASSRRSARPVPPPRRERPRHLQGRRTSLVLYYSVREARASSGGSLTLTLARSSTTARCVVLSPVLLLGFADSIPCAASL